MANKTLPHNAILVDEVRRPLHIIDPVTLRERQIAEVVTRKYQGEKVQRHALMTQTPDKREKMYMLGTSGDKFGFVDHSAALRPLIDAGFTIRDQVVNRGGVQCISILSPAEIHHDLLDPIQWDKHLWLGHERDTRRGLQDAMVVFSSIKPGQGERFHRAIFSFICTNGMTAELLDLGSLKMNHLNFSGKRIESTFLNKGPLSIDAMMGPYLGSKKGVKALMRIITNLVEFKKGTGDDAEADDESDDENVDISGLAAAWEMPFFIRQTIKSLYRLPLWYLAGFQAQLQALLTKEDDRIMALDILTAITSTINLARATGSKKNLATGRLFNRVNAITEATTKIIGASSL